MWIREGEEVNLSEDCYYVRTRGKGGRDERSEKEKEDELAVMTTVQVIDRSPSADKSGRTLSTSCEPVNSPIIRISFLTLLKSPKNQAKRKRYLRSTPFSPTSKLPGRCPEKSLYCGSRR